MAPSQKEVEALGRTIARRITALVEVKKQDEATQGDRLDVTLFALGPSASQLPISTRFSRNGYAVMFSDKAL
jgi:hypothetical protein